MTHSIPFDYNTSRSPLLFGCTRKLRMMTPLLVFSLLMWLTRSCTPLVPHPTYAIPGLWDGMLHSHLPTAILPCDENWSAFTCYRLSANRDSLKPAPKTLKAIVPQTQTLTSGTRVKLELCEDMYVKGLRIPQGTLLYGACRFGTDRMRVPIRSLVSGGQIIPVALSVYDLDGLEGIHIPQTSVRQSVKSSGARAVESIGLHSRAHSLGSRAAIAGIYAARNLLGKKIRKVQVTLRAGYHLLLKDQTRQ